MLFRIGAGIVIKENNLIQSNLINQYTVLGSLNNALTGLLERDVDEIHIIHGSKKEKKFNDFLKVSNYLKTHYINIPIILWGGLKNNLIFNLLKINCPVERFVFDIFDFLKEPKKKFVKQYRDQFGTQSIILNIPFKKVNSHYYAFSLNNKNTINMDKIFEILDKHKDLYSEIVFHDLNNHGNNKEFDFNFYDKFKNINIDKMIFGGVKTKEINKYKKLKISATIFDNSFFFKPF